MKEVRRCVCVLHVWIRSRMTRGIRNPNNGSEVSKSSVDSHLRYILTAGVAVLFFTLKFVMFERNLSAFPFSNFINFLFQPLRFVCKSDVRQIFVGFNSIVREIYVLSFEIVVLCQHLVMNVDFNH
jgi:hypothetical protein